MDKLLIVRAYRYPDSRQLIMLLIEDLWNTLHLPAGVRVAHVVYPNKTLPYEHTSRIFPFAWRCWMAVREWLRAPAEWVCIMDADVTPLRKDAINLLLAETLSMPTNTHIITSNYLVWITNSGYTYDTRTGYSYIGLCTGASDGAHTIHHTILPLLAKYYHHYCPNVRNKYYYIEPSYNICVPRYMQIKCYSQTLFGVHYTFLNNNLWDMPTLPAFIQFVGDLFDVHHQLAYARDKLLKG